MSMDIPTLCLWHVLVAERLGWGAVSLNSMLGSEETVVTTFRKAKQGGPPFTSVGTNP